ncbi:MAG: STAS-like domain-containing protein [Bacteroidia bacterium]|nr:STAS-like domain-containing protein [Bacteroidia bacterium]
MEKLSIQVYNIVGSPYCVEAEDGYKVYAMIKAALAGNRQVELSFLNVEILTTAFLNTAVGQLYRDFSEEQVKAAVSVAHITPTGRVALRRVVETAKLYYKDPEAMERSVREVLGE